MLEKSGYNLSEVTDPETAIRTHEWNNVKLTIIGVSVSPSWRREVLRLTREDSVTVLDVDAALKKIADPTPEAFLHIVGQSLMLSHQHPEIKGRNLAWVDGTRRYVHVTDGFLSLIGYDRDEVIGRRIEDFTYPHTANTAAEFRRYVKKGEQTGIYFLRHKSGKKIPIEYEAIVLPDGCMCSKIKKARIPE